MVNRYLQYGLITLVLLLLQTTVLRLVALEGISPDVLAIWIAYLAVVEGQMSASVWGFGIGLVFDFVTGNFIGLFALTKTICGFVAGFFFNENTTKLTLASYRYLLIVLISSFCQNVLYFLIFTLGSGISPVGAIIRFGVPTSLYTAALSLFPIIVLSRRSALQNV